jgi:hypothetical protein
MSFFEDNEKPVLFAAALLLIAFTIWTQNIADSSMLVIGLIAVIVIAFVFEPGLIDPSVETGERSKSSGREREEDAFQNSGEHSRASEQQLLEIPEEHEEEAHHTLAGH